MLRGSTAGRKSGGLTREWSRVGGGWVQRGVMCFRANGCLIMPHIHCTMSLSVRTCQTNWHVTSMDGLMCGISTGDGSPITAIWRGKLFGKTMNNEFLGKPCCYFDWYLLAVGTLPSLEVCRKLLTWNEDTCILQLFKLWSSLIVDEEMQS